MRFLKQPPSVYCLIFVLFCLSTPLFCQTPAIEAADKALSSAKHDFLNTPQYAVALRDLWQAYHRYLKAEKEGTPDTLNVLLLNQEAAYRLSMDSLVKVSTTAKKKHLRKLWQIIAQKERGLYQDMAKSLDQIGSCYYGMGNISKPLPHFELMLSLYTKLGDKENYFESVPSLAIVNGDLGKLEVAQSILEKAITELEEELKRYDSLSKEDKEKTENKWLKKGQYLYTGLITRLCGTFQEKGDFNAAVLTGKKAIAAMKEIMKDTSYKVSDFSNPYVKLATVYNDNYMPDSAIIILNESLAYYSKASPDYFSQRSVAYQLKGDMGNIGKTAMESYELAQNNTDKTTAKSLLFVFYLKTGQYNEAFKWLNDHSESVLKLHGKDSYIGDALPNYFKGVFYNTIGELDKAEIYINKGIAIQKSLGYSAADFALDERELARIYDALGQYDKSLKIKQQAFVSVNNRVRALDWSELGYTYLKLRRLDSASLCYVRSNAILHNSKKTIEFALNTNKLGQIAELQHNYTTAEKWYREAQSCMDSIELTTPENRAEGLSYLSSILRKNGKHPESLENSEKSLAILRGVLKTTDVYRKAQLNCALLHEAQQQNTAATDSLQSLFQNIQTRITKEFAYLTEQDKVAFMTMLDNDFFGTMQAASARLYAHGEAAKSGALFYNTVLMQKELSLVDTRSLKRKASVLNDTLLFAQLFKLNAFEEQVKSDKPIPPTERQRMSEEITQIKAGLEQHYPQLFEHDWTKINWQSVQKQLKPHEIAIEFADVLNNDDDTTKLRHYFALVITPTCPYPSVIPLFEEQTLKNVLDATIVKESFERKGQSDTLKVSDAKTVAKRYNSVYGKKLYDLIWQPLESANLLRGVTKVHFAPSGMLNRVAFSALPLVRDTMRRLMEIYPLRQYNSTRDIGETLTRVNASAHDLVLFGDIQYGKCEGDSSKIAEMDAFKNTNILATRSALFLDSISLCWAYLPSGKAEVENITRIQKTRQANATAQIWTGYNAHEARFKSYGSYDKPSPSTLYISTHGFGNPSLYPESRYASAALHRAGLVMARANWTSCCHTKLDRDEEDGIVTAYEISNMNLSNTELVILNGCQTGLGELWGREGVFGLTRGFKLAGANFIIASLWEVPDAQAAEFMTAFYDLYLSGKSITAAFEDTRQTMRMKQEGFTWAAWVLIR